MLTAGSRRTRIEHRDFICKSSDHHQFRAAVKLEVSDDGTSIERSATFRAFGDLVWMAVPLCPTCSSLAEEAATYDPKLAAIPESERFEAWLSPDGQRIAVPGKRGALMPERYVAAGYRRVEAHSMRDFDRFSSIRAQQTGNDIDPEMNYDPQTRQWFDDAAYDPDDMTARI